MSDVIQERHIQTAIEASSKHYFQYHTALEELGKKDVELANLRAVKKSQERKIAILESNLAFAKELIDAETIPTNIVIDFAPDAEAIDAQEWNELCSLFPVSVKGETASSVMQFEMMMPF